MKHLLEALTIVLVTVIFPLGIILASLLIYGRFHSVNDALRLVYIGI